MMTADPLGAMKIDVLTPDVATDHLAELVELLVQAVENGALGGFVWPLDATTANDF